jgi:hypothetical protein
LLTIGILPCLWPGIRAKSSCIFTQPSPVSYALKVGLHPSRIKSRGGQKRGVVCQGGVKNQVPEDRLFSVGSSGKSLCMLLKGADLKMEQMDGGAGKRAVKKTQRRRMAGGLAQNDEAAEGRIRPLGGFL